MLAKEVLTCLSLAECPDVGRDMGARTEEGPPGIFLPPERKVALRSGAVDYAQARSEAAVMEKVADSF
jgi:hypothetical protein